MRKPWCSEDEDLSPEWTAQSYGHGFGGAGGYYVKVHAPEQHLTPSEARVFAQALLSEADRAEAEDCSPRQREET